jgi:hypothetical protein
MSRTGLLLMLMLALPLQAAEKLSVPDAAAQAKAEAQVRDIFKAEFMRTTPDERLAFAKKLLKEADETKDNPAARYVLLRDARDLAAQAGNLTLAKHVMDMQGQVFAIDLAEGETSILTTAAKTVAARDQIVAFMDLSLDAIDQRMADGNYPEAVKLLPNLNLAANHLNKPEISKLVVARSAEVREMMGEYISLQSAMKHPPVSDPGGYLATGKYLCIFKNDWKQGIASLSLCKDKTIQQLAEKDAAGAATQAAMMELANGWFEAAPKPASLMRKLMLRRAAYWYGQATAKLTGLDKALAEKRVIACFGAPEDAKAFGGNAYAVSTTKLTWREAKVTCRLLGGHLVCVENADEQQFIADLVGPRSVWIGLTDEEEDFHWHWVNGKPLEYAAWASGEPNHKPGGTDHYVHMWNEHHGHWADANDFPNRFMCEWGD